MHRVEGAWQDGAEGRGAVEYRNLLFASKQLLPGWIGLDVLKFDNFVRGETVFVDRRLTGTRADGSTWRSSDPTKVL